MIYKLNRDADELVLMPLERIVQRVQLIANNPNKASEFINLESEENKENFAELSKIESAVAKIGQLLAIGFGEAGSEIIS